MPWRVAESLLVLLDEINAAAPDRSKVSDGTIGDADHASRSSDHNPWVIDSRGIGVVRARDITHDPAGGCDAHQIAEHIRLLFRGGDPRARYVISNGRIASSRQGWAWRRYSGPNAHTKHAHVSVTTAAAGYDDTRPWGLTLVPIVDQEDIDMIRWNTRGHAQLELQRVLNQAATDQGGPFASLGGKYLILDGHAGTLTFTAALEMLERGTMPAFANKAAVNLLELLDSVAGARDRGEALRTVGVSGLMASVFGDLAAAR